MKSLSFVSKKKTKQTSLWHQAAGFLADAKG